MGGLAPGLPSPAVVGEKSIEEIVGVLVFEQTHRHPLLPLGRPRARMTHPTLPRRGDDSREVRVGLGLARLVRQCAQWSV